jgi:hypothetical protein
MSAAFIRAASQISRWPAAHCNHPERADDIDTAIGELSIFHQTHGYYEHGVSPKTGWEQRVDPIGSSNRATRLCIDVHNLVLSKYEPGVDRTRSSIKL